MAKQNKLDKALPLYLDCYEFHRAHSGPCARATSSVLIPLTETQYKLRDHQANVDRLEQFCRDCEREEQEHTWAFLKARNRLGRAYSRLEHFDKAETVLLETFDQVEDFAGDVSESSRLDELTNAASRLAGVYQKVENVEKFEGWKRRHRELSAESKQKLVDRYADTYGPNDPKTLTAKRDLAFRLMQLGNDAAARPLLVELFDFNFAKDGWSAEYCVELAFRLAVVEHALNMPGESAARLQGYLDWSAVHSEPNWSEAKGKSYLGRAKIELGQYASAETVLLEAFDEIKGMEGDVDAGKWRSEMRKVANRLMELYDRMENPAEESVWRKTYERFKTPAQLP